MAIWKCPICRDTKHLRVIVKTEAKLHQGVNMFDNFETEVVGDHEWDGDSPMSCTSCGWAGKVWDAEEDEDA